MVSVAQTVGSWFRRKQDPGSRTITVDQLTAMISEGQYSSPQYFTGDKFDGGFGTTKDFEADYWTLRTRSRQLFHENLYGRGLIRRLITNEINTGLEPEANPNEKILGLAEDSLTDWSDDLEDRHGIWAGNPTLCDYQERQVWGAKQREIRREALIAGDVLIVLHIHPVTQLPQVQVISGDDVEDPGSDVGKGAGNKIVHGVELDKRGRQVAYWVREESDEDTNADVTHRRVEALGAKSGRRIAWLVYGSDKLMDDVRGQPLLSLLLQSVKELDRYRDSAQRKATVNSILAMFIEKNSDKPGTLPGSGGSKRKRSKNVTDVDASGATATRKYNIADQVPGVVYEELQTGEIPRPYSVQGTDVNFPVFEAAILHTLAWANEVPPEILTLAFQNNYSASQAAINEFKVYLNKIRSKFGSEVLSPVYVELLTGFVITGKVTAAGFLESRTDAMQYDVFGAWVEVDWSGAIKPSTDIRKQAEGYKILVDRGWMDNARAARELTGTKFRTNTRKIKRENELLVEAMRPLKAFEAEFAQTEDPEGPGSTQALEAATRAIVEAAEDLEGMRV